MTVTSIRSFGSTAPVTFALGRAFFSLPGMGRLLFDAIFRRDLMVVQGVVLVITVGFVIANGVVDVLYSVLDPRIRQRSPSRA